MVEDNETLLQNIKQEILNRFGKVDDEIVLYLTSIQ